MLIKKLKQQMNPKMEPTIIGHEEVVKAEIPVGKP